MKHRASNFFLTLIILTIVGFSNVHASEITGTLSTGPEEATTGDVNGTTRTTTVEEVESYMPENALRGTVIGGKQLAVESMVQAASAGGVSASSTWFWIIIDALSLVGLLIYAQSRPSLR